MITGGFSRIVEHNYLTKSRGKQGYDEEDIFALMMVYASKDGIDDVELDDFEIPSHSLFKTDRWDSMLRSGSYYHIPYNVKLFEYNDISENYYLVVRSDFKNYQIVV